MAKRTQVIDISRALQPGLPESSALPRFALWWHSRQAWGDRTNFQAMLLAEHTGTNVDAPRHVVPRGATLDELGPAAFIGPALVLDLSHLKPLAPITPDELQAAEARAALRLRRGDIAVLMTRHDERCMRRKRGAADCLKKRPALTGAAAKFLAARRVKAVGMDTVSPDPSGAVLDVHRYLLERRILIIEGLSRLEAIGPGRFLFIALPLKIKGGTGSPVRAIAVTGDPAGLLGQFSARAGSATRRKGRKK